MTLPHALAMEHSLHHLEKDYIPLVLRQYYFIIVRLKTCQIKMWVLIPAQPFIRLKVLSKHLNSKPQLSHII